MFAPAVPTGLFGLILSGCYRLPAVSCQVYGVLTNTTTVDAYRGAGRPEAAHLVERLVSMFAAELGMDPVEVRRKNCFPPGLEPSLEATTFFDPSNFTWPFGTHICVTEVDPESGHVAVLRYVAIDDCGFVMNPLIVDGQVHGGITQGLAQALYEGAEYDASGQLLTGSLMDYAIPKAAQTPAFETAHTVTLSPVNPLGVKGIGEAGTIAASAAVVNSVVDALAHLGVRHLDMPLKPERVWQAIRGGAKVEPRHPLVK